MSDADSPARKRLKAEFSVRRLRGSILRSVSRSFYLSVRLLPARLREPVALGYLLARATDTVADTAQISPVLRAEKLATLSNAIQGKASPNAIADLAASFAPRQRNPDERALIESLPRCLEWLENLDPVDRNEIRAVLEKITRGQTLDLQRFANPAGNSRAATRGGSSMNTLTSSPVASANFGRAFVSGTFEDSPN